MKFNRFTHTALGLLAAGSVAWGCSSKSTDCKANLDCGAFGGGAGGAGGAATGGTSAASGTSGTTGGTSGMSGGSSAGDAGSAGAPDAGCDATLGPEEACTISDQYGLFVSKDGDDSAGDGTMEKPFATLTKALDAASAAKVDRLYVCAGAELAEPGTLMIPDHVSIYGGFKTCTASDWTYDTTGKTKAVLKPASPIGAKIAKATSVVLQDLRIDAADAPEDGSGASSFGMIVSVSSGVVLTHVEIHAGTGGAGKAGTDGAKGADGADAGAAQNGTAAKCSGVKNAGGTWAAASACGALGGSGADGLPATQGAAGAQGIPVKNVNPPDVNNGGPIQKTAGAPGGIGGMGSPGLSGTRGATAPEIGVFSAAGYVSASGGAGTVGFPGQGGGGGGASAGDGSMCVGGGGGAGGMGGCGGDPGMGGTGGGASVALLSWNSMVKLDGCTLVAAAGGAAGRGGNAHAGGIGKPGGIGGLADNGDGIGPGGSGGAGGSGGNGGNGAGGSGGPSIALVWSVMRPSDLGANTLTKGPGGALGAGGKVGGTSALLPGFDGQPGKSVEEYELR